MQNLEWDRLRYFLAVARHGSLAAASRFIGASQATVWRKIFALEQTLGQRLFDSRRTGYVLTAAGLSLLPLAEQMQQLASRVSQISSDPRALSGTVRLMAPEVLTTTDFIERLGALKADYPNLTFELVTASPFSPLSPRDTDLALGFKPPYRQQFATLATFPLHFALYASGAYLKARGRPGSLEELAGHDLVDFDHSVDHIAPKRWLAFSGRNTRRAFRSNSPHARKRAVQRHLGLALLPCIFVGKQDRLIKVIAETEIGKVNMLLLMNRDREQDLKVLEAGKHIAAALQAVTGPPAA